MAASDADDAWWPPTFTSSPSRTWLAWWIVHAARDPLAMPVPDLPSAEEWLSGSSERLDEVDTSPGRARKERPREE